MAVPEIAREIIPERTADAQALTVLVRDEAQRTVYAATLPFAGLRMNETTTSR